MKVKYAYILEILFTCTITGVKVSILSLYCTIFPTKSFRHASLIIGILCLIWAIVCLLVSILQCRPVQAAWDLSLDADIHCLTYGRYILGYELSNMFLDVTIISLPVLMIRRLQLPLGRKILVSGIFVLGGL